MKGKPKEEATWEDEAMIRSQFPEFQLEDKLFLGEDGTDTAHGWLAHKDTKGPKPWLVYERRGKKEKRGNE